MFGRLFCVYAMALPFCCCRSATEAVAALLQPIQQTQQQQAQELSNFKVMLEEMKGENSEAGFS